MVIPIEAFRDKRTLIVGDVNTGKTSYSLEILKNFLREGAFSVAIIDMAPESVEGVGGKMCFHCKRSVAYHSGEIAAPRLSGKTKEEIERLAKQNAVVIERLLEAYVNNPAEILFINDVSIYLQAGSVERLVSFLDLTPTLVMNGYFGETLGGGDLGMRERENMERLQGWCDNVIRL